jgi:hypothetical protein
MGNTSVLELLKRMTIALADSPNLIAGVLSGKEQFKDIYNEVCFQSPDAHVLAQSASSTACGWGGMAGQAFTDFYVSAIEYPNLGIAIIYVGRPAYICKIDESYRNLLVSGRLPLWDEVSKSNLEIFWKAQK